MASVHVSIYKLVMLLRIADILTPGLTVSGY